MILLKYFRDRVPCIGRDTNQTKQPPSLTDHVSLQCLYDSPRQESEFIGQHYTLFLCLHGVSLAGSSSPPIFEIDGIVYQCRKAALDPKVHPQLFAYMKVL